MPAQSSHAAFTPADTSADTPGDPSAFITTTDQEPDFGVQVRSVTPVPVADAAQSVRAAGRPAFFVPRWVT